ncbi:AbrB/MazE/SpoVT family DNA-binding domain-containing protein [Candidatus Symbiobacter mobilis]|uniref:SpoVT/AbrB domain protein n=1 Tax=Candidatus Symbiobacter mobilis CR TaxID=946483 RepID=U5ND78_9BURK|nr:AbrB/MazE/SpoVT family DNA-binding domain-containing protein [Candidatus Symbiobacter mobilis]AGX88129.1 SpoVT/AbrB domain protein [Candidatus Symbiobacter mobilis CR]
MQQTAKLFRNGRSQAVRLPEEFRFEGQEVYIEKQGNAVILKPKPKPKTWDDFFARTPAMPTDFLLDRQDEPPQDRQWPHDLDA